MFFVALSWGAKRPVDFPLTSTTADTSTDRIEPFIASMEEHRLGPATEWASVQVREKIYLNQLAEFDFRHYVFSRKFSLLINMQRPFAAVRLAILFLQDLYDLTLRSCAAEGSSKETLAKVILFLSSWTCAFVAAIENDTRLQAALNLSTPPPPATAAAASSTDGGPPPLLAGHKCYSALGDLIYCARSKVGRFFFALLLFPHTLSHTDIIPPIMPSSLALSLTSRPSPACVPISLSCCSFCALLSVSVSHHSGADV